MKFNELGFSPETTATEAIVQGFLDSNFAYFNPGGFDLSIHYMSDRQCLKRMSLKNNIYPFIVCSQTSNYAERNN